MDQPAVLDDAIDQPRHMCIALPIGEDAVDIGDHGAVDRCGGQRGRDQQSGNGEDETQAHGNSPGGRSMQDRMLRRARHAPRFMARCV